MQLVELEEKCRCFSTTAASVYVLTYHNFVTWITCVVMREGREREKGLRVVADDVVSFVE